MLKKLLILILNLLLLTSCTSQNESKPVERQEFHMGTIVTARVYGKNAENVINEAMEKIKKLEAMMDKDTSAQRRNSLYNWDDVA